MQLLFPLYVVILKVLNILIPPDDDPFIELYADSEKKIVYDRNTKVKYIIIDETSVTPLYNPDGSLQIYNESEEGGNVDD